MSSVMIGTIRGRVIELDRETEFLDGQRLSVILVVNPPAICRDASSAIEECAGAWADATTTEFAHWEEETARLRRCEHRDQITVSDQQP